MPLPRVIQHRGLMTDSVSRPNNIVCLGMCTAVEIDVFLAGSQILVLHNRDHGLDQDQAEALRDEAASREISPLELFLREAKMRDRFVLIELKASSPEIAKALAKAVVEMIQELDINLAKVAIQTFSVEALLEIQKMRTGISYGLLLPSSAERATDMAISATISRHMTASPHDQASWIRQGFQVAQRAGCRFLSVHHSMVEVPVSETNEKSLVIWLCKDSGLQTAVWVVDDPTQARELLQHENVTVLTETEPHSFRSE